MIGVSGDGGLKWTFVSGSSATEQTLKLLFPSAAGRLKLPKPKPPELTPQPDAPAGPPPPGTKP